MNIMAKATRKAGKKTVKATSKVANKTTKDKKKEIRNTPEFAKWLELKDKLNLGNDDIAKIVNLTTGTVMNQVAPSNEKMSTWMKGMVFMWERVKALEDEIKKTEDINHALVRIIKESNSSK
jgi:hypothetical protein